MRRGEIARSVSRGAFYLAVEKAAGLLSGVLYFALLLRWMGPTKYGIITLALSFIGLATMATGNLEMYLERFAAEHEAHGRLRTLRRAHGLALALKLVLGTVAGLLLVGLTPVLVHQFDSPELAGVVPVLALIVACDGLSTSGRAVLYGLQRFRWICGISVAFHVAKTTMVGLLWWAQKGLPELAAGLAVLSALQGILQTLVPVWLLRRVEDRDPRGAPGPVALLRAMAGYCLPLLGARAAFLSGQNLGKVVLGKLVGLAELGYFSFAFQTVERFVELAHTLPAALLPSLTRLVTTRERDRLRWVFDQAFRLIQWVACGLSLALFLFAPELTRWVGSAMFEPAVPALRIMALVPLVRTAQQPFTMVFQALRLPGTVLALALVKFGLEMSGYLLLVPVVGWTGAGWANLLGAMGAFAGAHLALRRSLPEGGSERLAATLTAIALAAPFAAAGLAIDAAIHGPGATLAKLGLAPLAVVASFALGLVTRYDLEKVSSLPLRAAWMRRTRDAVVAAGHRLASAVALRRAS